MIGSRYIHIYIYIHITQVSIKPAHREKAVLYLNVECIIHHNITFSVLISLDLKLLIVYSFAIIW